MGLADLFRPRHRHSDPAVRRAAVRLITDADVLAALVRTDGDPEVRRLAIERLERPALLAAIAREHVDREVQARAAARAASLWVDLACRADAAAAAALAGLLELRDAAALAEVVTRAADPSVRGRALDAIDDPRALATVVRAARDDVVGGRAMARIHDRDVLGDLAIELTRATLALAALDRLAAAGDRGRLERIASKAKLKVVRNRARERLGPL